MYLKMSHFRLILIPISSGPYVLKDYDQEDIGLCGKKRKDWDKTPTGIFGKT